MKLIISSRNLHKIQELRHMLKPYSKLDVFSLLDFPNYSPPAEGKDSLKENAVSKAIAAAEQLHQWVIADDTGLVVPALQGEPGVHSARYAREGASDLDNRRKLLKEMENILDPEDRHGYFECWLAVASPSASLEKVVQGCCEGTILFQEKGGKGFGYDTLFRKLGYHQSFAELKDEVKNKISHRRKAIDKLASLLQYLHNSSTE